jgi:hypothetical protein
MRGSAMLMSLSRNSYIFCLRRVTFAPTGWFSLTLKFEMAILALRISGF